MKPSLAASGPIALATLRQTVTTKSVFQLMIVDCVMAGMGRSGSVYPLAIPPDVLMAAFQNTVELLKREVVVCDAD